jgi:hypothetical protein
MTATTGKAIITSLDSYLGSLEHLLGKARAHMDAKEITDEALLELRMIADMAPLKFQVQVACELAGRGAARLAGAALPDHPRNEQTLDDLLATVQATRRHVTSHDPAAVDDGIRREHSVSMGSNSITMSGATYVYEFLLPNFFFHVTTTYAMLRENGVPLGKRDYMASVSFLDAG